MTTRTADRAFRLTTQAAAGVVLVVVLAIGAFLVNRAVPALRADTANFLTETSWFPDQAKPVFGIAALAFGTLVSSMLALLLAVPVAVGTALFVAHYAPRRLARLLGFLVDLLAAVPSVVYGLWGLYFLKTHVNDVAGWLDRHFGSVLTPLHSSTGTYGGSLFLAGIVLAIMILPIISAIVREVFLQVPRANIEAALALGATRWEAMRLAVLPYGRPGIVSASMLGLGRALGETIAVALLLSTSYDISWHITQPGGATFAANIALKFNEAGGTGRGALIASGLVLFVITLLVNGVARAVVRRPTL
ncbi:MAG: phosphate transport system permease protein [Frankiaceae bacterium]|nr:phosphate transport system permease protein [Frankiaceae bacterium]